MIRFQWRRSATALPPSPGTAARRRPFSQTSVPRAGAWPLLRRRSRRLGDAFPSTADAGALVERQPDGGGVQGDTATPYPARTMLKMHGLSSNLNASDFYRLIPNDLSNWQNTIKKGKPHAHRSLFIIPWLQQVRSAKTLEPNGQYRLSFSSAAAAIAYRDLLERLHRLDQHRLHSPTGLWEYTAPEELRTATPPEQELQTLTLFPASQSLPHIERGRVRVVNSWAQRLRQALERHGCGVEPPTVRLEVQPPTLTAQDLARHIALDGAARDCDWDVSVPLSLDQTQHLDKPPLGDSSDTAKDHDTEQQFAGAGEKPSGRYVVVCANEPEARRFHRHWNQKVLRSASDLHVAENIVHASIIKW
ncbi:hypothetical protein S40288_02497 [Stachybotrys chartarum IBT 40288]|nr:hypothetical protein S40288_02497 [Stachybotrys chartarum IBT 40288]